MSANVGTSRRPVDLRAGDLLDVDQTAALLRMRPSQVYRLSNPRRDDPMPSVRLGGARRWILGDVEAWIASRRHR